MIAPFALSTMPARVTLWRGRLIGLASWGAFASFSTIFLINIIQILVRPFGGGFIWVHDLSALLFAWTVMLGAAAAYGKFDHIVASFLVDKFPPTGRQVLAYFVRVIEITVAFILLMASLQIVETRMNISYIQLGIPTGWAYLSVTALGAFMLVFGLTAAPRAATAGEQLDEELDSLATKPNEGEVRL